LGILCIGSGIVSLTGSRYSLKCGSHINKSGGD
jgi:hypothetical protein